jgi:hypothetical protein
MAALQILAKARAALPWARIHRFHFMQLFAGQHTRQGKTTAHCPSHSLSMNIQQRNPMALKTTLLLPTLLTLFAAVIGPAQATEKTGDTLLILDASGSMWGQIGGQPKIQIARDALAKMLSTWSPKEALGLMAYGHRRKGDCGDIELLGAPQLIDPASFKKQVNALQPKGMTPITASVRQAAEVLKFTEHKATVILVSDGEETCNADPCALGTELEKAGIDFTTHVIGFDLPEGKARAQLQCLAKNTGGRYVEARNAAELNKALGEIAQAPAAAAPAKPPKDGKPTKGCRLFEGNDFKGESTLLGHTTYEDQMPAGWDNRVQSLKCAADAGLYLYNDPGREGEYLMIENGAELNNLGAKASSYIYFGEWGED